jgi:hypothetical protein
MQLDEQMELAFKAGCEWCREYYQDFSFLPSDDEMESGYRDYINGDSESIQTTEVLDKSSS